MQSETASVHPLAAFRAQARMSQSDLANLLGLSRAMVGHIENRVRNVSAEDAIRFETLLDRRVTRHELRPDIFGPMKHSEPAKAA